MCLGIPGRVIEIRDDAGLPMGKVDFGGVRKDACLAYIPEVQIGDFVIVHVGFAISRVDEDEALKTLEILSMMGDLVGAELATMGPGMELPAVVSDDGQPSTGAFAGAAGSASSGGAAGGLAAGGLRAEEVSAGPVSPNVKYLDEYRDPVLAKKLVAEIHRITTRPWTLMEVCGGQTHTIVKQGIDEALPDGVRMIHGPGCPVCVTPLEQVDKALAIAARPDVIFASYGDMLRVPGSSTDLLALKARGADVRIVYSPLDALKIALANPDRQVVFFAVGFETTAPANAMAVFEAARRGIDNFSVLVSHVLVPPAMIALLESPSNQVQAFLAAGHVCAIMGWTEYEPIAAKYGVPIVVTGFEPLDLLEGILMAIRQLEDGRATVENQYVRAVRREGVPLAQQQIHEVFETGPRKWRGIGSIPDSGYRLRAAYARFDAEQKFDVGDIATNEHPACIAGAILTGEKTPLDCTAYGTLCSPQKPLGAPMVSSEGTCAAYFAAGRGLGASGYSAPVPLIQLTPVPTPSGVPGTAGTAGAAGRAGSASSLEAAR